MKSKFKRELKRTHKNLEHRFDWHFDLFDKTISAHQGGRSFSCRIDHNKDDINYKIDFYYSGKNYGYSDNIVSVKRKNISSTVQWLFEDAKFLTKEEFEIKSIIL